MKFSEIINEKRKELKLIFTNYNDRTKDVEWPLTRFQLDRLIDMISILKFVQKRLRDKREKVVIDAVINSIKTGQQIQDETLFGSDFAVDVAFGDSARGERFYIRDDGTITFKFRLDQTDQPGVINFDDNFTQFKSYIKSSLK